MKGKHIGTLDIGRARVVWDGIGGAGSLYSRGKLGRMGLHKHARITMVPTISGWPPVAIEVQFGRAQEKCSLEGLKREVRGRVVLRVPVFSFCGVLLPCWPCFLPFCLLPVLSEVAGAGAGAGAGVGE